jgi:hypothetical protein
MSNEILNEIEELNEAVRKLNDIQKGNTSPEVVDAIVSNIEEDELEYDQVAMPAKPSTEVSTSR